MVIIVQYHYIHSKLVKLSSKIQHPGGRGDAPWCVVHPLGGHYPCPNFQWLVGLRPGAHLVLELLEVMLQHIGSKKYKHPSYV